MIGQSKSRVYLNVEEIRHRGTRVKAGREHHKQLELDKNILIQSLNRAIVSPRVSADSESTCGSDISTVCSMSFTDVTKLLSQQN